MARVKKITVGDRIQFVRDTGKSYSKVTDHEGTIVWVASSLKFCTVTDHTVEVRGPNGPFECDIIVEANAIKGGARLALPKEDAK